MDTRVAEARRRIGRGVTSLSSSLHKPVALNDRFMVPVASSPHEGPLDASRLELIFGRPAPRPVLDELIEREQINEATCEPKYIEGFNGLDLGRAFVPVRGADDEIVGYLWVIDPERSWSSSRLKELSRTASRTFGADLTQVAGPLQAQEDEHLDRLAGSTEAHRVAIVEIAYPGGFDPTGRTYQWAREFIESDSLAARFDVEIAANSEVRGGRHVTELILAGGAAALVRRQVSLAADYLIDRLRGPDPQARATARAVISPLRGRTDETGPMLSALRDLLALKRDAVPGHAAVDFVEDSDVFLLLAELRHAVGVQGYRAPASVEPLLADERTRAIARTAKAMLDSDAGARETADRLFIHRGTLYYRVNQAQSLTGLSLTGVDRLRLHLGLIIAELNGQI